MRSLRGLFPRVAARRVWTGDGAPVWEFRFTSRPGRDRLPRDETSMVQDPQRPVRFVSSRGVELGGDTLRVEQFHHRIRRAAGFAGAFPDHLESPDVAPALLGLAADPEDESAQYQVVARLARVHPWLASVPVLDISAARITGAGLGQSLDGVFLWQAEGGCDITYLVSPDLGTRDLLAADPDLVRALLRAACPQPDDALGDLESSLREAITRLGVVPPGRVPGARGAPAAGVVLRIDPDLLQRSEPLGGPADREKSDSERALSEELAELARRVGTASVRKPSVGPPAGRALEAG